MKFISALAAATLLFSCSNNKKEDKTVEDKKEPVAVVPIDTTLVTDTNWGPISSQTNFEGLIAAYGKQNVKDERICGAECIDSIDVTLIYPETNKEIIVFWKDSLYHKSIGMLENRYLNSPYHTASGIRSGSTMEDLLRVNGQKINFLGFGWDYGGGIQSYNKGALDSSRVYFRLDLAEGGSNKLLGDVELDTNMPEVKKNLSKIQVWQITLSFYER